MINIPSLVFFLSTMSHNMTPREGFSLFRFFLNFSCPFLISNYGRTGVHEDRRRASLNLHWISEETTYCESKNDFFQKITGDRSCTCSTNRTHFQPIRQTFFLFNRDGRKGLRCPG